MSESGAKPDVPQNGYIKSFNARHRDELLNGEIFYTLEEIRVITGWWREHYNKARPHSALDRRHTPMVVRQTSGQELNGNAGNIHREYWAIDGRIQPKDDNVGLNTPETAREMRDIDARLKHMDELRIDVQVLYPTFFLRPYPGQ